jgi:hypothetical protein
MRPPLCSSWPFSMTSTLLHTRSMYSASRPASSRSPGALKFSRYHTVPL